MRTFCLLFVLSALTGTLTCQTAPAPAAAGQSKYLEKAEGTRTLLNKGEVAEAQKSAEAALTSDPGNAELLAAAGDVYYRMANMAKALEHYQAAVKADPKCARGIFGLARMHRANSNFLTSRGLALKAHQLAPDDGQIAGFWMNTLDFSDKAGVLSSRPPAAQTADKSATPAPAEHPYVTLFRMMNGGHPFELADVPEKKTIALRPLMYDANHQRGVGLLVSINGAKPLTLMLDTGASGVLIKSGAAKRINLTKVSDTTIGGIGDRSDRSGFLAYAEDLSAGGLKFKNCPIEVIDRNDATDDDGLIGGDVFAQFLITLDFANLQMRLDPLPKAARSNDEAKLTDRSLPPGMEKAAKVYRSGDHLLVPAKVGGAGPRYFLVDTGAGENSLSLNMAKELKGFAPDEMRSIKGINGRVERVYQMGEVVVEFAGFRQKTRGMTIFDMDTISRDEGFETGGILGYGLLRDFEMKIDYRDGLIDFKYVAKPHSLFASPSLNGEL